MYNCFSFCVWGRDARVSSKRLEFVAWSKAQTSGIWLAELPVLCKDKLNNDTSSLILASQVRGLLVIFPLLWTSRQRVDNKSVLEVPNKKWSLVGGMLIIIPSTTTTVCFRCFGREMTVFLALFFAPLADRTNVHSSCDLVSHLGPP